MDDIIVAEVSLIQLQLVSSPLLPRDVFSDLQQGGIMLVVCVALVALMACGASDPKREEEQEDAFYQELAQRELPFVFLQPLQPVQ